MYEQKKSIYKYFSDASVSVLEYSFCAEHSNTLFPFRIHFNTESILVSGILLLKKKFLKKVYLLHVWTRYIIFTSRVRVLICIFQYNHDGDGSAISNAIRRRSVKTLMTFRFTARHATPRSVVVRERHNGCNFVITLPVFVVLYTSRVWRNAL